MSDESAGSIADDAAATDGPGDAGAAPDAPADGAARRLDFADAGRHPAVDAIVSAATERLAASVDRELESALRFAVGCEPAATARRRHAELVDALAPGAPCVPLALTEPAGQAWLLIDRALAFALADRRYGGSGQVEDDGRALSASERRVCLTVRRAVCRALESAWAPFTALRVRDVGGTDAESAGADAERFARSRTVALWHECPIEIDAGNGPARCTVLIAHPALASLAAPTAPPVVHRLEHAAGLGPGLAAGVRGCEVELVGVLAERGVTLGELAALRTGDFLVMDERRAVRFRAEGRAVFDARLELDAGRLQASVTHLHLSAPER